MTLGPGLLMIDLDGVIVHEAEPPLLPRRELLRLHAGLAPALATIPLTRVVVTHRSRAEAEVIVRECVPDRSLIDRLVAAEDLFRAGLVRTPLRLLRRGIRKSLIVPVLERQFGVHARDMIFIDDRLDNLQDVLGVGLGLALHAPIGESAGGLTSFRFTEVGQVIDRWHAEGRRPGTMHRLEAIDLAIDDAASTGVDTVRQSRHGFNFLRAAARKVRSTIVRPAPLIAPPPVDS